MLVFVNIYCCMSERKPTEQRKEDIFKAVLKIIHEDGKEKLTTRRIAEQVGISEAAIYRHFKDKKDILTQLAERIFGQDLLNIEVMDFRKPQKLLQSIIRSIFSSLEENPYSTTLLFHEELFTEYPELREMFEKHRKNKMEKIEGLVRKAQEMGEVSEDVNPEMFANIFTGSIRIMVLDWRSKNFSYSLKSKAEDLAEEISRILEIND